MAIVVANKKNEEPPAPPENSSAGVGVVKEIADQAGLNGQNIMDTVKNASKMVKQASTMVKKKVSSKRK